MIDVSTDARAHLRICGTCYALYETERPDGMNQRCRCTPHDEPRWPGHDFNEHALLCLCCGLEVVSSGSRWSSCVCRECQLLAMGVSLWERRLVFPIGRHSMMHTWVPDTRVPSLAAHGDDGGALAASVHDAITLVARGSAGLYEWSARIVSRRLQHLGLPGGTLLNDYLAAVAVTRGGTSRWEAFAELCQCFRAPPCGAVH